MLLAIDTATRIMSIALHSGEALLAERSWHTPNRHTVELAPAVQQMLDSCDSAVADLTGLGVAIGPGSYTGVRIGVAFAKGLAASQDLPLVGMTTLDILAAGQPYYQSRVGLIAVIQAGRGRIIAQSYRWRKSRWESRSEARLMSWETLLDTVDGPAHITGEINENGMEAIADAQGRGLPVNIASPDCRLRRAGFLAQRAWDELQDADDLSIYAAFRLLPIYVQSKTAS